MQPGYSLKQDIMERIERRDIIKPFLPSDGQVIESLIAVIAMRKNARRKTKKFERLGELVYRNECYKVQHPDLERYRDYCYSLMNVVFNGDLISEKQSYLELNGVYFFHLINLYLKEMGVPELSEARLLKALEKSPQDFDVIIREIMKRHHSGKLGSAHLLKHVEAAYLTLKTLGFMMWFDDDSSKNPTRYTVTMWKHGDVETLDVFRFERLLCGFMFGETLDMKVTTYLNRALVNLFRDRDSDWAQRQKQQVKE